MIHVSQVGTVHSKEMMTLDPDFSTKLVDLGNVFKVLRLDD